MEQSLIIAQLLLKYGPTVAASVQAIFSKVNPTAEDWENVFVLARTPFDQGLLPGVLIPPTPRTPPATETPAIDTSANP